MQAGTDSFDISNTVTRLKRLSLTLPQSSRNRVGPVTYSRLMDLSVERIEVMARSAEQDELLVATRLLENPKSYYRWEKEHSQVMHRVAQRSRTRLQSHELLAATFELIHRKSLFEHLRQHHVCGARREQLLQHFFSGQGYVRGMIAEHGIFLRSSASLACSSFLGTNLLHDAVFQYPLHDYEQMYAAYFDAYCEQVLAADNGDWQGMAQSVVYSLKCDLAVLRRTIAALANRISTEDARCLDDTWS